LVIKEKQMSNLYNKVAML